MNSQTTTQTVADEHAIRAIQRPVDGFVCRVGVISKSPASGFQKHEQQHQNAEDHNDA